MATPSISLGTSEVTPLELTAAYVPFSNGGRGVIPFVIRRIVTARGKLIYQRTGSGLGQVIDPGHVGMMNSMLADTILSGTGRNAALDGWPAAGKTGTSQDFRDAWFIGYTGALTAGVWFGNDDNKPTKKATGGSLPAETWHAFMSAALDGLSVADLPGNYRYGTPANAAYGAGQAYPSGGAPMVLAPGADDGRVASAPEAPRAGPVPPGNVGGGNGRAPDRTLDGFFQRLFGG